jgi:hypothetical protein
MFSRDPNGALRGASEVRENNPVSDWDVTSFCFRDDNTRRGTSMIRVPVRHANEGKT